MKLKALGVIFYFFILFFPLELTYALEMESTDFRMNLESIDAQVDSSTGYIIKKISPNASNDPFTFYLSNTDVNFGEFVTNTIRSNHINYVINSGFPGYQISALQEASFKTLSDNVIANTDSNYGLSYNLSNEDKSYYRTFPLKTLDEEETIIMSSQTHNTGKITINFKLNIPSTQPKGSYRTIVNFMILPGY